VAEVLCDAPLLEKLADSLELRITRSRDSLALVPERPQRFLHVKPVLDRKVRVHLGNILDEKSRAEFFWVLRVEDADLCY
jgi:hypothetical protein